MSNVNLSLASASDVKTMVETGKVDPTSALVRVDAVLARQSLTEGKKRRWSRLREWLVDEQIKFATTPTHG